MSDILKKAIKKISKPGGFDETVIRATVLSVNKNALTCSVQTVSDNLEIDNVKLKPVANGGDLTKMGLVVFPAIGSFVLLSQAEENNIDLFIISCTEIESIALDTATALNLLVTSDGKLNLNATLMTLNGGNNGGVPLSPQLTKIIGSLQLQVNTLIDAFNSHVHSGVTTGAGVSGTTIIPGPAKTSPLIKVTDIENKSIVQ